MSDAVLFRSILDQDDLETLQSLQEESGLPLREFLSSGAEPTEAPKQLSSGLPPGTIVGLSFTHPLLLMFLHGAERCCRHATSALQPSELIAIQQPAGNVLHALIAGSRAGLQPRARFEALLSLLLCRLSRQELQQLCALRGHLQLRPAELAIHWDEFRLAERLLCNGALRIAEAEVRGPHGIVTFETDDYEVTHEASRAAVSPLMLLTTDTSLARVRAMKEANILRIDGLINAWTIAMEKRNFHLHVIQNVFTDGILDENNSISLKSSRDSF